MPLIQIRVSDELKTLLEEEAALRGVSVSAFIREAAMLSASRQHVTMHVEAYAAMIEGLTRGGQMVYAPPAGENEG